MKSPKEILQEYINTPIEETSANHETICVTTALLIVERAQREAYNEALEDVKREGEACTDKWFDCRNSEWRNGDPKIDEESIDKLKKQ